MDLSDSKKREGSGSLLLRDCLLNLALNRHFTNDSCGNCRAHITQSKAAQLRKFFEGLENERPERRYLHYRRVAGLYRLWFFLGRLAGPGVDLRDDFCDGRGDLRRVRVEDGRVSRRDRGRMEDDYDLREELLRDRWRARRRSQHRAAVEVGLRDAPEVEADVVPGLGLLHGRVVGLYRLYLSRQPLGHYYDRVAYLHLAGLHSSDWHRAYSCDRVDVLDRDAERLLDRLWGFGELVEGLNQYRTLVPGHVGARLRKVLAGPS